MSTPPNQQKDPEQLRREIEEIRRELGKTVAQLAQKDDVEAQVREDGARELATGARQNPAPLAVGGALVVGFLIGRRVGRRRA